MSMIVIRLSGGGAGPHPSRLHATIAVARARHRAPVEDETKQRYLGSKAMGRPYSADSRTADTTRITRSTSSRVTRKGA